MAFLDNATVCMELALPGLQEYHGIMRIMNGAFENTEAEGAGHFRRSIDSEIVGGLLAYKIWRRNGNTCLEDSFYHLQNNFLRTFACFYFLIPLIAEAYVDTLYRRSVRVSSYRPLDFPNDNQEKMPAMGLDQHQRRTMGNG